MQKIIRNYKNEKPVDSLLLEAVQSLKSHTHQERHVFSIQSHVSEGDKEKSDDAII